MNSKQFISLEIAVLDAVRQAAEDIDLNLIEAMIRLGLPPDLLQSPEQFVPSHLFNVLLEFIAKDYHCRDFALKVATHIEQPMLGLPGQAMVLCANVQQALLKADQYCAFYHDTSPWQHHIGDGQVFLFKPTCSAVTSAYQQRSLLGTAQMFQLIEHIAAGHWLPDCVSFSFADPGVRFRQTFDEFFRCPLIFEQDHDGIYFNEQRLDHLLPGHNPQALGAIETHLQDLQATWQKMDDVISRAKLMINQRLSFASCTLVDLARFLEISENQLQQQLAVAGVTFEQLLEQQVCEKANYYLTQFHAPTELVLSSLMPGNEPRLSQLLMDKMEGEHQW